MAGDYAKHRATQTLLRNQEFRGWAERASTNNEPLRVTIHPPDYQYPVYDTIDALPEALQKGYTDVAIEPGTDQGFGLVGRAADGSIGRFAYVRADPRDRSAEQVAPGSGIPPAPIPDKGEAGPKVTEAGTGMGASPTPLPSVPTATATPTPQPIPEAQPPTDDDRSWARQYVVDPILRGTTTAGNEFNEAIGIKPLVDWLDQNAPDVLGPAPSKPTDSGIAETLVEEAARTGVGLAATVPVARALGVASQTARWVLGGLAADTIFQDPDATNLADVLEKMVPDATPEKIDSLRDVMAEAFAKSTDDTDFEKRLKNGAEGIVVGAALDGVVRLGKSAYRLSKSLPDATKGVHSRLLRAAVQADEAIKAERASGIQRVYGGGPSADEILASLRPLLERTQEPFYYNTLQKAVRAEGDVGTKPAQWWLDKFKNLQKKGVKQPDIELSGIEDWLKKRGPTSAQEIDDYLAKNAPYVEVVSERVVPRPKEAVDRIEKYIRQHFPDFRITRSGNIYVVEAPKDKVPIEDFVPGTKEFDDAEIAYALGSALNSAQRGGPWDYQSTDDWLRLAQNRMKKHHPDVPPIDLKGVPQETRPLEVYSNQIVQTGSGENLRDLKPREFVFRFRDPRAKGPVYEAPHYEQELPGGIGSGNLLANALTTTRMLPDPQNPGKRLKTLVIEETQSDWVQTTRGKKAPSTVDFSNVDQRTLTRITDVVSDTVGQGSPLDLDEVTETYRQLYDKNATRDTVRQLLNDVKLPIGDGDQVPSHLVEDWFDQTDRWVNSGNTSIAPPPVTNWQALVLKEMTRYATVNGYDAVVWMPPVHQAIKTDGRAHRTLYEKVLPNEFKKLSKAHSWEAPLERFQVPAPRAGVDEDAAPEDLIDSDFLDQLWDLGSKDKFLKEMGLTREEFEKNLALRIQESGEIPTLGYRITPQIKNSVQNEGLPQWAIGGAIGAGSAAGAQGGTEEDPLSGLHQAGFFGRVIEEAVQGVRRTPIRPPAHVPTTRVSPKGFNFAGMDSAAAVQREMAASLARRRVPLATFEHGARGRAIYDVAQRMGISESVLKRVRGPSWSDQDIQVAQDLLEDSVQEMNEYARLALREPTDDNLGAFRAAHLRHRGVINTLLGRNREADTSLLDAQRPAADLLATTGGRDAAIYATQLYNSLPDNVTKSAFIKQTAGAKTREAIYSAYINGLLSNFTTPMVNVLSTLAFGGYRNLERGVASGVSSLPGIGSGEISPAEVFANSVGYLGGLMDILRLSGAWGKSIVDPSTRPSYDAMRDQISRVGLDEAYRQIENTRSFDAISGAAFGATGAAGRVADYAGYLFQWPGKLLRVSDAALKVMAYRGELYSAAVREARDVLDRTGDEDAATQAMRDIIMAPSETMHEIAMEQANVVTFTRDLEQRGKQFDRLIKSTPLRYIVPFVRTPMNILKETGYRIPILNMMSPKMRADWNAGGARRDEVIAKTLMGGSLLAIGALMADAGVLTGSGHPDLAVRWQTESLTGRQRYSVNIAGTYYNISRLEPLSTFLTLSADTYDLLQFVENEEDAQTIVQAATMAILENLRNKTFLQGLTEFTNVIGARNMDELDAYGGRFVRDIATSLVVPNLMVAAERMDDPVLRVTDPDPDLSFALRQFERIKNEIKARTPGLSDSLPPLRDAFGNQVKQGTGTPLDLVNPFYYRKGKYSRIAKAFEELGIDIDLPRKEYRGIKLDAWQHDRLIQIRAFETLDADGLAMTEVIEDLIDNELYNYLPKEEKIKAIRGVVSKFNRAAVATLFEEDESLKDKLEAQAVLRDIQVEELTSGVPAP